MSIFTRWFRRSYAPQLTRRAVIVVIPENTAVLCEACHHFVSISGFIPHLSGTFTSCPNCGNTDPNMLKFVAAWIRTPEEQKAHWEGGKTRTGKITAINGGIPKPLPPRSNVIGSSAK